MGVPCSAETCLEGEVVRKYNRWAREQRSGVAKLRVASGMMDGGWEVADTVAAEGAAWHNECEENGVLSS